MIKVETNGGAIEKGRDERCGVESRNGMRKQKKIKGRLRMSHDKV